MFCFVSLCGENGPVKDVVFAGEILPSSGRKETELEFVRMEEAQAEPCIRDFS